MTSLAWDRRGSGARERLPDEVLDRRRVVQVPPGQPHDLKTQGSQRVLAPLLVDQRLSAVSAAVLDQAVELDDGAFGPERKSTRPTNRPLVSRITT
jgi:hypothetical protein